MAQSSCQQSRVRQTLNDRLCIFAFAKLTVGMFRYFSSWPTLAVSTRPCQLPKLPSAFTTAQRSLAQKGQKPAPIKNTSVLPLGRLRGWSETCMNLPRTFRGMKVLLGLLLVLTTRKVLLFIYYVRS